MAGIEIVREAPKQGRVNRNPKHPFAVTTSPYVIQPFFIAPVLPGETMKNLLVQAKGETSLVQRPLGGWWMEMYVFYVKHRDLIDRDLVTQMHLDPNADTSALIDAAPKMETYFAGGGIDWVKKCRDRVIEEYFRDEGEPVALAGETAIGGGFSPTLPIASVQIDNWADSMIVDGLPVSNGSDLPGEGEPGNAPGVPDDVPVGFETHWETWSNMRAMQLTDATFEDYLKSFGVRAPRELREDLHRPELLRYIRDWQLPAPSSQRYVSAVVDDVPTYATKSGFAPRWALSERADKDRYFAEPGFIFGVCVCRPKAYFGKQKGAAVQMLDNAYSWLPAILDEESYTSVRKVEAGAGVLPDAPDPWWFDAKDIFMHGDQFVYDGGGKLANTVALPTVSNPDVNRRYATGADIASLFDPDLGDATFKLEGIVQLTIASRLRDTSL